VHFDYRWGAGDFELNHKNAAELAERQIFIPRQQLLVHHPVTKARTRPRQPMRD
jgi:hypothetical protein